MPALTTCTVYHGSGTTPDASDPRWRPAEELFAKPPGDEAGVLVVDASMLDHMGELSKLPRRVVFVAADETAQTALGRRARVSIAGLSDPVAINRVIDAACLLACARLTSVHLRQRIARHKDEFREMGRISMGLMLERDRDALLRRIIDQGKRLTGSDAGGIFLTESDEHGVVSLRLALWNFDSLPEFRAQLWVPIDDTSIVGHAARIRTPVVVADANNLPADAPFQANNLLEVEFGYCRKSMLAVPMIDHLDRAVGVLAFVNRKPTPDAKITDKESADQYALPYGERELYLARALASQAAVSIENAGLYQQIERNLESFVKASAAAIDQRDPTTAGHSIRVSALVMSIAQAVERTSSGRYAGLRLTHEQMRELQFAALLHDFGKIAVREDVLVKAKKLPPVLGERVSARFELIRRTIELEYSQRRASLRCSHGDERVIDARLEQELAARLAQLDRMWQVVRDANEPTVLPEIQTAELSKIAARTFERGDGSLAPYLTQDELHFLQLPSGTLDDAERAQVEAHVDQTHRFLINIPWTDDLKNLVTYAYGHHEKLDGSGYPRQLKGDEIPFQARVITIADIFDALTEADRPYKRALPPDQALDILRAEAAAGRVDRDVVEIMIESQAYRQILESDWHRL
jgi:HD-GYP domain-containing protein (c-di-GMP phosphodiesterase class II)